MAEKAKNLQFRELSEEFRSRYVKKLHGKSEFCEYNGLMLLARNEADFGFIRAYLVQKPSKENDYVAIARAEVFNKEGQMTFVEEADASVKNVNKGVANHYIRMGLTRAKGRVLREYLCIDMVTKEELDLFQPDLADSKTIGKIKKMAKEASIAIEKVYAWMEDEIGVEEFNDLTQSDADSFIDFLEKKIAKILKKRAEKAKASDEDDAA